VALPTGSVHLPREQVGAARAQGATAGRPVAYVEEAAHWLPSPGASDAPRAPTSSESATAALRPRVLIVDDNADMRAYIGRLLGDAYEVDVAADGEDAIARISRRMPDLVLSDVMMPRMDGFAFLHAIRSSDRT